MAWPPYKEPVHDGKPTPEELVRYKDYLWEQLRRPGVRTLFQPSDSGVRERRTAMRNARRNWIVLSKCTMDLLVGMGTSEWVSSLDLRVLVGMTPQKISERAKVLSRCGYAECRRVPGKVHYEWRLTDKGRTYAEAHLGGQGT